MASMDNMKWHEIDKLLVIQNLKKIIGDWWGIQINITDHNGYLRGVPEGRFFQPLNPLCQCIVADDYSFRSCVRTARKTTQETVEFDNEKKFVCHANFSVISVPIRVSGEYLGCVFADGFLSEDIVGTQKKHLQQYFNHTFPNKASKTKEWIDHLPILSNRDIGYLTKLVRVVVDELVQVSKNLAEREKELFKLNKELSKQHFANMIGKSKSIQEVYHLIERVSYSDTTIFIQGENGTGKELIARAIHQYSKRKNNEFIAVNCGSLHENLLESELFGHVKGAFSGASKDKKGVFKLADRGTLLLDEIGDTPMQMQVKLLRVLQEGTFTPVGGSVEQKIDVRVIAATNKNLEQMVAEGTFRQDLYYRLNVLQINAPPLRERKEDIPLLVEHFLRKHAKNYKIPVRRLSKSCLQIMLNHNWEGNIRELENEIERLCVLATDERSIGPELLSPRFFTQDQNKKFSSLKSALEAVERELILEGLKRTRWNKSKLARELGISRAGLIIKVERYGLDKRTA